MMIKNCGPCMDMVSDNLKIYIRPCLNCGHFLGRNSSPSNFTQFKGHECHNCGLWPENNIQKLDYIQYTKWQKIMTQYTVVISKKNGDLLISTFEQYFSVYLDWKLFDKNLIENKFFNEALSVEIFDEKNKLCHVANA